MASRIKKNFGASVTGVLDITDSGTINVEVEDVGIIVLNDFIKEFNGKDVKITISYFNEDF